MGCQIFPQWRWVYLGSTENWSSGLTAMLCLVQVPIEQRTENTFTECKQKNWGVHDFSSTESMTGKKKSLSSSCWFLLLWQDLGAALSGLPPQFGWGFCLLILCFPLLIKIFLWKHLWSRVMFSSLNPFVPWNKEGNFLGTMCHAKGKAPIGNLWRSNSGKKKSWKEELLGTFLSKVHILSRS